MVTKTLTVKNAQGFHMRPATIFAGAMGKFDAQVILEANGKTVDGKSVMNLIAACIKCGTAVKISCDGTDETAALEKAVEIIESGFGE